MSGLVDISLAQGEILYDVEHMSNYVPTFGDEVWCIQSGPDLIVWDRVGTKTLLDPPIDLSGVGLGPFYQPLFGPYILEQRGPSFWEQGGGLNSGNGGGTTGQILPIDVAPEYSGASNLISVLVGQSKIVAIGMSALINPYNPSGYNFTEGAGYVGFTAVPQTNTGDAVLEEMYTVTAAPWYGLYYRGPVGSSALLSRVTIGELPGPGVWTITLQFSTHGSSVGYYNRELWAFPL